ncbi:hypothetical protein [Thermogutta sp.]|uniref:hypothetical protein n=1 Tax=Thermogutta sp. TaxID=1962930 RepID=UPI003C7A76BE
MPVSRTLFFPLIVIPNIALSSRWLFMRGPLSNFFLLVVLSFAATTHSAWAGVVVLVNKLESEAEVEIRDGTSQPRAFRIPSGGLVPVFATTSPVVGVKAGSSSLEERAELNTIYEIALQGESIVLRQVHVGNLRPGVWIAPSQKMDQRTTTIPVALFVDEEQPAVREVWEPRLRRQVEEASKFVEWFCGVRFQIVRVGTWTSDNAFQSVESLLDDFRRKVRPDDVLLVLGVSSQLRVAGNGEFHYPLGLFESHLVIPDVQQTYTAQMQLMTLVHSFGHFLGAVDVTDIPSVMNPAQKTLHAEKDKPDYFDPLNTLVMNLVADELAFRNVRQVKELSSSTRNYLLGIYRYLGYRSRRPEAQHLFARFEETPVQYERFVAEWTDGSLLTGPEIAGWGDPGDVPELGGRKLFGDDIRIRWIVDTQPGRQMVPAEGYIEFVGGDRLPGKVESARPAEVKDNRTWPARLRVYPYSRVYWPDGPFQDHIDIVTAAVKRVVWKSVGEEYQPGWAFLTDGRRVRYRAVQWTEKGVRLLTEEGIEQFAFDELAELHLPGLNPWESVIRSRVGLITGPDDILMEIECADGLRVTTSLKRFWPRARGDKSLPDSWYHMVQPPWSTQPLWIPHRAIIWRRVYGPGEVPLTRLEGVRYQEASTLGARWGYHLDANLLGRPLHSAGRLYGWGIGVTSGTQLTYPLHPWVNGVRLELGIDSEAGDGGCIWGEVLLAGATTETLARSPVLVGSQRVFEPGEISLVGKNLENAQLVLKVDEAEGERPLAADPWNIRDLADWLEPTLVVDTEKLLQEIHRRQVLLFPCWEGWRIVAPESDAIQGPQVVSYLDQTGSPPEFRWTHVFRGNFAIERTILLPADAQALEVLVCRPSRTPGVRLEVLADGQSLGDTAVPERGTATLPEPFRVDVSHLNGRKVTIRLFLRAESPAEQVQCEWYLLRVIRAGAMSSGET